MSQAIAGIKAEMKSMREALVGAAESLDESHKEYTKAQTRFHRDQMNVERINGRIKELHTALTKLGGRDD